MSTVKLERIAENPFLLPDHEEAWQSYAAFNPCVIRDNNYYHLLYRAMSAPRLHEGITLSVSSIGLGCGKSPFNFPYTQQFIQPTESWERFGCEDPRVTKLGDTWYIFYTALSAYPFDASNIRIGVALTRDFKTISEKHLVTPFNAKAMALFPEKINGKYAAILTVDTDIPPAKIALAFFDDERQIWSDSFWKQWYETLPKHVVPLLRNSNDHLEVGAAPVKTKQGWLLVYSYIRNYFSAAKRFGIEAVLLDLHDPSIVIGRTEEPLLTPEKTYELLGDVPNVIFPSGALLEGDELKVYYGATDTTCCMASMNINDLLDSMCRPRKAEFIESQHTPSSFRRYADNPIITPRPELPWETQSTFNPAALYEDGNVHILYRAMSADATSVLAYARSKDGVHIDQRPTLPVYEPRELFEQKSKPGASGCEDPRLTRIGDHVYLFYTAYDGHLPRVAFSSILLSDFLAGNWRWKKALAISPPDADDKDACIFPEKINGKFAIFHRINNNMYINYFESLDFENGEYLDDTGYVVKPRKEYREHKKFGISAPPIRIDQGWLLFFHHVSGPGSIYKVEALLLDYNNPSLVLAETAGTLLEPEMDYEKAGDVANVVFPCGAVLKNGDIYLYYGGADKVVGVAKMSLEAILKQMGI